MIKTKDLIKNFLNSEKPSATAAKIVLDADGWTYRTRDGSRAAHFEHTVLVKKDECEVLTKLNQ